MGQLQVAVHALDPTDPARPALEEALKKARELATLPSVVPRDPLPEDLLTGVPERLFELDKGMFSKNLRSARRGAAAGPSGMTVEHLQPLLDHPVGVAFNVLVGRAVGQSRRSTPSIVDAIRQGRITALRKPSGGVRGIVVGDVIRRVVARTLAQQLGPAVEGATAPFQCALSTKAGCECVSHVVQGLTEADPDLISREAMLDGLLQVDGGGAALPFVRLFYGRPSQYLWEDSTGTTHLVHQGEGGEQGDPLMPLLYSVGQHRALEAISRELLGSEKLLAYLGRHLCHYQTTIVWATCTQQFARTCGHMRAVSINNGKTKVWNAAGNKPAVCEVMDRIAQAEDLEANVWRGSEVATERQGLLLLGAPLGHPDFVAAQLPENVKGTRAVSVTPSLPDVQAAWLLLVHCANARANYLLRVVPPDLVAGFAQAHDVRLWSCLFHILGVAEDRCDDVARNTASLPMALGGLGLRSAARTSPSAFWASWADCLPMVQKRHPEVAACIVEMLNNDPRTPCLQAAAAAAEQLDALPGFTPPTWHALALGARPPPREPEENEPRTSRTGWQHEASSRTERPTPRPAVHDHDGV